MKLIRWLMFCLVGAFFVNGASGQGNAFINVLTQNGGQVNQGGTVNIEVTVGATLGSGGQTTGVLGGKLRAVINTSSIASPLPNAQQTGLPPGWTIVTNTATAITICN
ncbi:MAG TPA: hypothetical protein VFI06_14725, partial [Chitinophagaceae bacterium]|nr:hypothetical protein [Chitinophagaceae bacterium]